MKKYFVLGLFLIGGIVAFGQKKSVHSNKKDVGFSIYTQYVDTLQKIHNKYFAGLDSLNNDTVPERNIELKPYYFKLFVPLTYYYAPIEQAFESHWQPARLEEVSYNQDSLFPVTKKRFDKMERADRRVNKALLSMYVARPDRIVYTENQIARKKTFQKQVMEKLPPKIRVIELFEPDPVDTNVGDAELLVKKPNFWSTGGDGALQFSQNYISDNWYKGGESSNSMVAQLHLFANYDDKQRIEFDNELHFNLGFISAPSDTVHKYRTNNDLLRLTSKLGIKAVSKWYYTLSAEFKTQFFSNYKTNSDIKQSAFMTPTELKLGLGMDYKLSEKKINLSVLLSPLSSNFTYLADRDVDPTAFGVKAGQNKLSEIGSRLQVNYTWTIIPAIIWESRFSYFTNYKRVESEWENTFNFVLNRYLSTKLFVHARYDDSSKPEDGSGYFQLKELLSFGINYKW